MSLFPSAPRSPDRDGVDSGWKLCLIAAFAAFALNQALEWIVIQLAGFADAPRCTWDCVWYQGIAENGYDHSPRGHDKGDAANWAFFPAFPVLAGAFSRLSGIPADWALVIVGKVCFFAAVVAFVRLARQAFPALNPWVVAFVPVLNPYSVYGNAGYTEPMFLLLSCAFLVQLRQGHHVRAGLLAGLLTAVRSVGVAAGPAFLLGAWAALRAGDLDRRLRILLGLALVPLGLALFMLALDYRMGDALAFSHIQRAWDRELGNPVLVIVAGLNSDWADRFYTAMALLALGCSVWLWRAGHRDLAVFSLIATLLPLTAGLTSMPRFVWWQAPVLLAVAHGLHWRRAWRFVLPAFTVGMIVIHIAWLHGRNFVL